MPNNSLSETDNIWSELSRLSNMMRILGKECQKLGLDPKVDPLRIGCQPGLAEFIAKFLADTLFETVHTFEYRVKLDKHPQDIILDDHIEVVSPREPDMHEFLYNYLWRLNKTNVPTTKPTKYGLLRLARDIDVFDAEIFLCKRYYAGQLPEGEREEAKEVPKGMGIELLETAKLINGLINLSPRGRPTKVLVVNSSYERYYPYLEVGYENPKFGWIENASKLKAGSLFLIRSPDK